MTRDEMWQELAKRNVSSVVVKFSGGNDEGGVDEIILCDKDDLPFDELRESCEQVWDYTTNSWITKNPNSDTDLIHILVKPVYDKYYSFAGEFYVQGELIYDVKNKKITMNGKETVESYEDFENEVL